ncbi:MAG TPA: pitrilysin family protein, partial [Syntrophothermus lipocalidus]|nr:pitrilysin family protein [Syntrophothermus lipocalidus]
MVDYWVLDNGARLVSEEIPHLRSVAMGIYVGVGSRDEADEMNGTTHFIEHLLFKGTATRTAKDIAEAFESIGGQLNAYTSKEYTCFYARTLDENFEEALDILFDMVFNSVFMDKDLLTEKGVIVEEIGMYEDSPDELIHDVFSQLLWRNHALGRPILGTKETVMALKRESVIEYYRQYYVPSNMVIAIAGNINNSMVRDKVSEWLHRVQNHPVSRAKLPPDIPPKNELRLITKDTEQVQLCIGTPSISYSHDERHVQNIMNSILGGGIGSRLFQTIREEKGLAY